MNKRQKRKEVEKALRESMRIEVWQDKPYTAVKVRAAEVEEVAAGRLRWAYGFDFVEEDKWDARHSMELAVNKAIAKIAKEIVNEEAQYDGP